MNHTKEQNESSDIILEGNLHKLFDQILQEIPPHLKLPTHSHLHHLNDYLRTGEIWVLAGQSGFGKSTVALNLIHDLLEEYKDASCAWISLDDFMMV